MRVAADLKDKSTSNNSLPERCDKVMNMFLRDISSWVWRDEAETTPTSTLMHHLLGFENQTLHVDLGGSEIERSEETPDTHRSATELFSVTAKPEEETKKEKHSFCQGAFVSTASNKTLSRIAHPEDHH